MVTEAHAYEQLAQGCYPKARGRESNPRPSESQVQRRDHYATADDQAVAVTSSDARCAGSVTQLSSTEY